MILQPDIASWVALAQIPGLGGESYRNLLRAYGEPAHIFSAGYDALRQVVREPVARAISRGFEPATVAPFLEWIEDPANHLVTLADPDYPRPLLEIPDPPPLLYLKGRRELLNQPSLAIIGSRNATPQGMKNAETFARHLSDSGLSIVSGLALGIDGAAHRGGLAGTASSIAVVGTGLDIVYPSRHRALAHELAERGTLISELPLGMPSKAENFPRRNRIISGLSRGCLVVEAALQSGSLITARLAAEQGREVFAIPGSIHSPLSKGCHVLIKQGAKLVESAQDILEEMGIPVGSPQPAVAPDNETNEEMRLLAGLGHEARSIDSLSADSGLTSETVCAMLLRMELEGRVASLPGGLYQRISQMASSTGKNCENPALPKE